MRTTIKLILLTCLVSAFFWQLELKGLMNADVEQPSQTIQGQPSQSIQEQPTTPIQLQSSVPRSIRLHTFNTWGLVAPPNHLDPQKLQAALESYSRRDNVNYTESIEYVNSIEGWNKLTPASLKTLNPSIKVYRTYALTVKNTWDTDWDNPANTTRMNNPLTRAQINDPNNVRGGAFDPNATDDWWLRDANNLVIKEKDDTWFIDIGRPGLKELYVNNIISRNQGKGFDGIAFDYVNGELDLIVNLSATEEYTTPLKHYAGQTEWFSAFQGFISEISSRLHAQGYRIIGNCAGEYNSGNANYEWQRSQVDGTVYEQFAIDWWFKGSTWLPPDRIEKRINSFNADTKEAWAGESGLTNEAPEFSQKKLVSLAMYYIAVPQNSSNRSYNYAYDSNVYWDPLWDFYIGTPVTNSPTKQTGRYFWSRKYTEGLVLLNYDSQAISYALDKEYIDPAGQNILEQ